MLNRRTALIADGKTRPLERPKRKNVIHLQATASTVDCNTTNRQLRKFLESFTGG
jgi:ribosomal protein L14E/L6E/L27E